MQAAHLYPFQRRSKHSTAVQETILYTDTEGRCRVDMKVSEHV